MKLSRELKVGLLAVVAVTLLYFGINFLRGIDFFSPTKTYYAVYRDIDGLTVSNQVLINGLTVGRVSDISIMQDRGNRILVELQLDSDIIVGDSTVALLVDSDLLGSKGIVLNIGRLSRPVEEGDTLIGMVDQSLTEAMAQTARPVIENIDSTISNLNQMVTNINKNKEAIDAIFNNLAATTRNLKSASEAMAVNLTQITATLSDPETGIAPLMTKLNRLADTVNNLELTQTVARANEAMTNLQAITEKINEGEGSLGKLMNDDSLYTNLNNSAESLDKLLIDVRENPKKYVHFSVFGRKDKDKGGEEKTEEKETE